MAPIAIAMPPSDMMLAFNPCQRMIASAISTPSGRLITATIAERTCHRNSAQTSDTSSSSSISLPRRLPTARSIRLERS